ncbi:MAG: glycosyltransferase family 1 protein [Thiobacillaceae bacterium]
MDVSVISRHDAGTGIQRVVRAILKQMLLTPPEDFVVHTVAATRNQPYRYISWGGCLAGCLNGRQVEAEAGDVFLGLDFSAYTIYRHRGQLVAWKKAGVKIAFLLHDLLPENHPEWFSPFAVIRYRHWIRELVVLSDIVFCNSGATEEEFRSFLTERFQLRDDEIATCVLPMGWDIGQAKWMDGSGSQGDIQLTRQLEGQKIVLMVGTIEPRKGYEQALLAFEQLWVAGHNHILVLVGRPGWKTGALQQRIRQSKYLGNLLYWFDHASDEQLIALYKECDGVLIASFGEGFGLPLVEALSLGKPVLVRRLKVFEESARGGFVRFFSGESPLMLANELLAWLESLGNLAVPAFFGPSMRDWGSAARKIVGRIA